MLIKRINLLLLLIFSAVLFSGCYSAASLKRTPQSRQQTVKKKSAPKVRQKKKKSSDDPVFDAIFHRDPQKFEKDSMLSEKERQLIREYDVRNDGNIKDMYDRNKSSSSERSDWVFGTKNGSYL